VKLIFFEKCTKMEKKGFKKVGEGWVKISAHMVQNFYSE